MSGWCADLFRAVGSLLYWNTRKTLFRLRGARGQAPCQNPSDSGRAHETGCDACLHWRKPRRFRHVCPLLAFSPAGAPICSVPTSEVRPFWTRAFLFAGAGIFTAYLLLVIFAFGFLKQRGYEISFATVALPTRWERFPDIQARLFFNKGREAYAAGRLNEAVLALSFAFEKSPENYEAGALLAWIWQASQPTLSNRIYLQLLRSHPDRRAETAQRWYRVLLNRGDFVSIAHLAAEQLAQHPASTPAWVYALLFASRQAPQAGLLAKALEHASAFDPEVRGVLQLEQTLRNLDPPTAVSLLLGSHAGSSEKPLVLYHHIDSLIRLKHGRKALDILNNQGSALDERSRATLKLAALGMIHDTSARRAEIESILGAGTTLAAVEFLTANLISYPEVQLIRAYFSMLEKHPLAATSDNFGGYAALYCLAALSNDADRTSMLAEVLRQISGTPLTFLTGIEHYFHGDAEDQRLTTYLSRLQSLPIEVVFALYERTQVARDKPKEGQPQ